MANGVDRLLVAIEAVQANFVPDIFGTLSVMQAALPLLRAGEAPHSRAS